MSRVQTIFAAACLLSFSVVHGFSEIDLKEKHPDVGLRVPELVTKYGYPIETYTVKTEDDYLLTVHRIPHGKNNADEKDKPVIFLMHGMLCSSADWVLMGPEKGLAYLLADRGYDVWMGNARGNTYSRRHASLDANNDKKFWKFSFHELGYYDIPAMIDFVLESTNQEKLYYIGHSQGTVAFFVMTSTRPEYNEKINLMVALAPVSYMKHVPNIALQIVARFQNVINWVSRMLGAYEFLPSTEFMQLLGQELCNDESHLQGLCSNILFLIAGFDDEQLNKTMLPVILSNTPAGGSTRQIIHFVQEIKSGEFRQYDHGFAGNLIHYKKFTPPKYNTNEITAPVALFYGQNDLLTSMKDIDRLHSELPHSVYKYKIKYQKFSHLDFLWATDVVDLLYNRVFDILARF